MLSKKFYKGTLLCMLICAAFFLNSNSRNTAMAAVTWTTQIAPTSDYGYPALVYNNSRNEFGLAYTTTDTTYTKFTTSSLGATWATPVAIDYDSGAGITAGAPGIATSSASGGYYSVDIRPFTGTFGSTLNGSSWTTSTPTKIDKYFTNATLLTQGSNIFYGGIVSGSGVGGVWVASSTNSGTSFATSSITDAGSFDSGAAVRPDSIAVAFTKSADNTHVYVATSTNGVSYYTDTITYTGTSGVSSVRTAFDRNGRLWVAYYVKTGTTYTVQLATHLYNDPESCGWKTQEIDTAGDQTPGGTDLGIAMINGVTPLVIYNYRTASAHTLRYALRDGEGSGCSGAQGTDYTCGDVLSGITGNNGLAVATNGSGKVVVIYQNTTLQAATADFGSASKTYSCVNSTTDSSSAGYSLKSLIIPVYAPDNAVIVNDGSATTTSRTIQVRVSAINATEMALSLNSSFYGSVWEPFRATTSMLLPAEKGTYTVYAKFANETGGVSSVADATIVYDQNFQQVNVAPPASSVVVAPVLPPLISIPQPTPSEKVSTPLVLPVAAPIVAPDVVSVPFAQPYSCPGRPNAFSLGGTIVKDRASGALYLDLSNVGVVCPVPSVAVARSWGVHTFALVDFIHARALATPVPYRPGSIVQDAQTGVRDFINTRGERHPFPDQKQFLKLGYHATQVMGDAHAVLTMYPIAATLVRTDIHPDGTLFVINARSGAYAILQNRELHQISKKTLVRYHENVARAVQLHAGEAYPYGVSWTLP